MPKTIQQTVEFRASPKELFDIYMDSKKHSAAVGALASISRRAGGKFWVFGKDAVRGRNLLISPERLIVQAWRAQPWKESDLDSILTLAFYKSKGGARIYLVQTLVPDHAVDIIEDGWKRPYGGPGKSYLAERSAGLFFLA